MIITVYLMADYNNGKALPAGRVRPYYLMAGYDDSYYYLLAGLDDGHNYLLAG
jgi:hypothetical protein